MRQKSRERKERGREEGKRERERGKEKEYIADTVLEKQRQRE